MRIGLLLPGLVAGGAETVVLGQAREYVALGHQVSVISLSSGGNMRHRFLTEGFAVKEFDLARRFRPSLSWLLESRRAVSKVAEYLKTENLAVLHTHLMGADILGLKAGRKAGIKVIVHTVHNVYKQFRPENLIEALRNGRRKRAYPAYDALYAVSDEVRDWAIACDMATPAHIQVVRNGIDLSRLDAPVSREEVRNRNGWSPDETVILNIGSLTEQKNQVTLLRAAGLLGSSIAPCRVVVAGEGPLRAMLEAEASKLPAQVKVELAGYRSDIPQLLKAADVLAFPSFWEGLPMVLLEAMYIGIPVVASDIPIHRRMLEDGRLGELVSPQDPSELALALGRSIRDTAGGRSQGRLEARRKIEAEYSSKTMALRYLGSYESILKTKEL